MKPCHRIALMALSLSLGLQSACDPSDLVHGTAGEKRYIDLLAGPPGGDPNGQQGGEKPAHQHAPTHSIKLCVERLDLF